MVIIIMHYCSYHLKSRHKKNKKRQPKSSTEKTLGTNPDILQGCGNSTVFAVVIHQIMNFPYVRLLCSLVFYVTDGYRAGKLWISLAEFKELVEVAMNVAEAIKMKLATPMHQLSFNLVQFCLPFLPLCLSFNHQIITF